MVRNNIALKDGDYPGQKNIQRFRDAVVNQANHFDQYSQQPQYQNESGKGQEDETGFV